MDKNELRICIYSSLLIALVVNSARLLALRENAVLGRYWHFDPAEYSFQFIYNLAFCGLLFYVNLSECNFLSGYRTQKKYTLYYCFNAALILFCITGGIFIQRTLFAGNHLPGVIGRGYIVRFGFSAVLVGIIIRIILLLRESKRKDKAHEQLKSAYLEAQLELLKEQLNPHLLFNSLSSLSGIVREDPQAAQYYIMHLSKVFRHALMRSGTSLVPVEEELTILRSYEQLLKMRFENAFQLDVDVHPRYLSALIPHLSLQPLLENASKHNSATLKKPLLVRIYNEGDLLVVSNTLQEIVIPENSTGIGLANLNERFRLMVNREIEISKTNALFVVKLPLTL